jgi:hypothetical protein
MTYQYDQLDTALRLLNGRLDIAGAPNLIWWFVAKRLWWQPNWLCEPPGMSMLSRW